MRFRSLALIALSTFVLAAGSAMACDKADAKSASAGSGCAAKAASADVKTADAGSACTGAKAASAGAGCTDAAKAASAGAGCADGAKAASAGSGCCAAGKAASAGAACADGAKAASAGAGCHGENAAAAMVVYNVSGMTCGGCASKVEAAVANLKMDGVATCTVDVEKGIAVVNVAEGKQVDSEALAKAITDAGFPAEMQKAEVEAPAAAAEPTETSTM